MSKSINDILQARGTIPQPAPPPRPQPPAEVNDQLYNPDIADDTFDITPTEDRFDQTFTLKKGEIRNGENFFLNNNTRPQNKGLEPFMVQGVISVEKQRQDKGEDDLVEPYNYVLGSEDVDFTVNKTSIAPPVPKLQQLQEENYSYWNYINQLNKIPLGADVTPSPVGSVMNSLGVPIGTGF